MLLALAWKNIWRNRKRSLIILVAIAFGLWGGLLSGAIMMGMGESMINTAIDRYLGHIQIHAPSYMKEAELFNHLKQVSQIHSELSRMDEVSGYSSRTLILGMASSPASSYGVRINGIDPGKERAITSIHRLIREGDYFESDRKNQIVIGRKLAKRLNLQQGSKIVLSFQGFDDAIVYIACRVTGIYKSASAQFDEMNVYVHQADLFRVLESQPVYHEIAIRTRTADLAAGLRDKLADTFPVLDVQTWKTLAPELAVLAEMMESFTILFVAIILIALVFGITNTMLMAVMERIRELGILIAVGMKRSKVFIMILTETVMLSLTGGIAGILIGALTIYYFSIDGIDLSAIATSMESFGVSTSLYPILPLTMYVTLTVLVIIAAILAAVYPAWKAIHLQPAEAVRIY